jgi:hypothetical protein
MTQVTTRLGDHERGLVVSLCPLPWAFGFPCFTEKF